MASRFVLVLDLGTSGPRCTLIDDGARVAGSRACGWDYLSDGSAPALAREFDTAAVWRSLCRLIADCMRDASVAPGQVAAVAATSQRQGVVFVDGGGRVIYAGPNMDLRAVFEGGAIDEEMADEVYRVTGHLPSFLFSAAKLRWFKLHRPEAYDRIASVLTLGDWAVWRLTGTLACEITLASEAGLLDIERREWCTPLLEKLGLAGNPMPLVEAGTVVSSVGPEASRETGLDAGTPVVAAGADTQCGLLGMGVSRAGQVGAVAGWSAPVQMVTPAPVFAPGRETWAGCFPVDRLWVLESSAGDAGNSYRWLADILFANSTAPFVAMDRAAAAVPVGSEGATAFFGPPRMNMADVGMRAGGLLFPVPLTYNDVGRGHLARAYLEAAAFAVRANLEQIERLAGVEAGSIAVGGGMTLASTWLGILADVVGREVRVAPGAQASAMGAYLCGRTAIGDYGSLGEASESVGPRMRILEPDPLTSAEYGDLYERWIDLSDGLQRLRI